MRQATLLLIVVAAGCRQNDPPPRPTEQPLCVVLPRDTRVRPMAFPPHLTLSIPMPEPWANTVAVHVRDMVSRGWALELSSVDLFHGHLVMAPGAQNVYLDPAAFVAGSEFALYHSDETFNGRWEAQRKTGVPLGERTPRSIVGRWDGGLIPAAGMLIPDRPLPGVYESHGTITAADLVTPVRRSIRPGEQNAFVLRISGGSTCELSTQFYILPDPYGRYALDGRAFDVYLWCTLERLPSCISLLSAFPKPHHYKGENDV